MALHSTGDMDTRYEGDRHSTSRNAATTTTTSPSAFNFVPLASSTYGYHPKSVTTRSKPAAGLAAVAGLAAAANEPEEPAVDKRPGPPSCFVLPTLLSLYF